MIVMKDLAKEFMIDPKITFLNFGSFGACPKEILEDLFKWQRELEFEPVQFIAKNGIEYVKNARKILAEYIGCEAENLVFVPNPTPVPKSAN